MLHFPSKSKCLTREFPSLKQFLRHFGIESDIQITPKFVTIAGKELFLIHVSYENERRMIGADIWPSHEATFSDINKVPTRIEDVSIIECCSVGDNEPCNDHYLWTQYLSCGEIIRLSGEPIEYDNKGSFELYNAPLLGLPVKMESGNILFFDTETTGLPNDFDARPIDVDNWPRLVQLAWIVTDGEGKVVKRGNRIVYPDGYVIPDEASRIHGISNSIAHEKGHLLKSVLLEFLSDAYDAHLIVGHNISYDLNVVLAEMFRCGIGDILSDKRVFCTMRESITICNLPGYKYPTLEELYSKLFGESFPNSHDAYYDAEAAMKCYWELIKRANGAINV